MSSFKGFQIFFVVLTFYLALILACVDRNPHQCQLEMRAHHCYVEHNKQQCCETCQRFRKPDNNCPYGDHLTNIVRRTPEDSKTYSCESYIGFFGLHHCKTEPKFREYCCASCNTN